MHRSFAGANYSENQIVWHFYLIQIFEFHIVVNDHVPQSTQYTCASAIGM